MPIKVEKIKLAGTKYDARAKLSPDQRTAIKVLSEQGYSQRKLAAMFNVSKRLIQSIVPLLNGSLKRNVRLNTGRRSRENTEKEK